MPLHAAAVEVVPLVLQPPAPPAGWAAACMKRLQLLPHAPTPSTHRLAFTCCCTPCTKCLMLSCVYRAQQLVAALHPEAPLACKALQDAGAITATCWVGGRAADLATGHVTGAVLLLGLVDVVPGLGVQGGQQQQQPPGALLLAAVRVEEGPCAAVQGMSHMWLQVSGPWV